MQLTMFFALLMLTSAALAQPRSQWRDLTSKQASLQARLQVSCMVLHLPAWA